MSAFRAGWNSSRLTRRCTDLSSSLARRWKASPALMPGVEKTSRANPPLGIWTLETETPGLTPAPALMCRVDERFPHTFLKAPYVEDLAKVANFDVTVLGAASVHRTSPGYGAAATFPQFGPQHVRYSTELHAHFEVDAETGLVGGPFLDSMSLCDAGDVRTETKSPAEGPDAIAFRISSAVAFVAATGSLPVVLGVDASIRFPTMRGVASLTSKKIGIIHFARHSNVNDGLARRADDSTTPYHGVVEALPNVPAQNLVRIGFDTAGQIHYEGAGCKEGAVRVEEVAEMALNAAWQGADAVWLTCDIDAFVPQMRQTAMRMVALVAQEGLCGIEVVCPSSSSAPGTDDLRDFDALGLRNPIGKGVDFLSQPFLAVRLIVCSLGSMLANGNIGAQTQIFDKPFLPF